MGSGTGSSRNGDVPGGGKGIVFSDIIEGLDSGVAVYAAVDGGRDFIFKSINAIGERYSRVKEKDILGKSVTEVFPSVKSMGLLDVLRKVWKTGKPAHHPLTQYRDKRITQWVSNYVFRLPKGEVVAVYNDLTQQESMQQELRRSEETFRSIFDGSNDGMFLLDARTVRILEVNRKACEMFGITKEDAKNISISDVSANDDGYTQEAAAARIRKALKSPQRFNWKSRDMKGRIFWTEATLKKVVIRGEDMILASVRDISERMESEMEIEKRTEELEKINRLSIGRELRMVDLKKRILLLEETLRKNGINAPG